MSPRTPAQNAELALLLEVAGTPKPGNVDRHRDFEDLRFEHFLAGAVGARPGLAAAAAGDPVGDAFERAVAGMAEQEGGNTQFGALLLLVPLVAATDGAGPPTRAAVSRVCSETTVADAAAFYRAFDHVDVFVGDPPPDAPELDVRRGSDAVPDVEAREETLEAIMERSAPGDGVAREWVRGFDRTFETADRLLAADGHILDRTADAFLELLSEEPDTLVATQHGDAVARDVSEQAADLLDASRADVEAFADDLVERGVNPGTTADVTAAGLYVALQGGLSV
ncbi:triphosphoribosyl-dephospho-CoA synthase [Halanaeroarchaeum sp. HSR-CO]|uniref:triphosphoribosyl-dephospho-CoA synthase n=1 Tax=Halanaeroarchaeum sp. HSR-CO TaxID=2866382 RepID=UPI00217ECD22|nr:triphosphoribosyl-dephospho-CoA synthase [Halanaeroarchaeum sp. HSR-CO]